MKIYRTIFAENIDTENFGCHWTFNKELDVTSIGRQAFDIDYSNAIQFEAEISIQDINIEATMQSNRDYSHEWECVVCANTELIVKALDGEIEGQTLTINTGTRYDKWVDSAECSEEEFGQTFDEFILDIENWD
jgi:hypothetical protein